MRAFKIVLSFVSLFIVGGAFQGQHNMNAAMIVWFALLIFIWAVRSKRTWLSLVAYTLVVLLTPFIVRALLS
jgi:hypothetical protein